jgi:alkylation response protein AidB-like acyl-CoA dehydrogenase
MNFDLSDEQRLLAESVNRFIADQYDFEARLHGMRSSQGWRADIWQQMAELGLLGLPFAEADGGFAGGGVETMIVMEALGRGLVVEPYLSTVIIAGAALRHAASPTQKAARIPGIIEGAYLMSLAHAEPQAPRHSLTVIRASAVSHGSGWLLSGEKIAVLHGDSAHEFIVSAKTEAGVSLFLVPADAPGVSRQIEHGYDGHRLATVRFESVQLTADALLGPDGGGVKILEAVCDEANAALAAEAVGVMADTLDMTVEYLKTRTQFGVAIGSFQALQHRAVDMLMNVELSRSMAILAALSLDRDPEERRRNIAAGKIQVGRAGRIIGQQAVQMHGAIGVTAEYKVGHAFKRLTAIDTLFGDADHYLDVLAQAGGLVPIV